MPNNVILNIGGFPYKFVVSVGPINKVSGRKSIKLRNTTGKTYPIDSLHTDLNWSFHKTVLQKSIQYWLCNILSALRLWEEGALKQSRKNGF